MKYLSINIFPEILIFFFDNFYFDSLDSTSLITFLLEYNDFPGDLNERMHELLNDGNRVHLDSNG